METQTTKKTKSVGFQLPWDFIGENVETEIETDIAENPVILISNEKSSDAGIEIDKPISKAHAEVKGRMLMTEAIITGETFSEMEADKKKEFIEELKFLTAVDAELSK